MWIVRRGKRRRWTPGPPTGAHTAVGNASDAIVTEGDPKVGPRVSWKFSPAEMARCEHFLEARRRDGRAELMRRAKSGDAAAVRELWETYKMRFVPAPAIGDAPAMRYRFACQFCQSRFSLAQLRDAHERACGSVCQASQEEAAMPRNGQRPITCRDCGHVSPSLKEHAAHLLDAHREATLARRRQQAAERKAARRSTVDAIPSPATPARAPAVHTPRADREAEIPGAPAADHPGDNGQGSGPLCPTCGARVPPATAALVAALEAEGLDETTAFTAVRIARQVFAAPAAARAEHHTATERR